MPGWNFMPLDAVKGAAIRRFMEIAPFTGRRPVFLGDDTPDENGFEAVNEAGGISIRVKPFAHTTARYGLAGVAETLAWLGGNFRAPAEERNRAGAPWRDIRPGKERFEGTLCTVGA